MTDRTTIRTPRWDLLIAPHDDGIRVSLLPVGDAPAHITVPVATSALLAAIDAADPDAMRSYLRETAPEVIADLYRPEQLDAVPEADFPEDLPETMIRQFGRAEALLASGNHLIAQASELLDSLAEELDR